MTPFMIPCTLAFACSLVLAVMGREGWGWFLLVAFLLAPAAFK